MNEITEWVKANAVLSHVSEKLIVGRYKEYAFRIFPGWIAVVRLDDKRWKESFACYNLKELLELIGD